MGRLLLDAHVVTWWDTASRALGVAAKKAIEHLLVVGRRYQC